MQATTPKAITPNIGAACLTISASKPRLIRSIPFMGSRPSFCFDNVAKKIARHGGTIEYGWAVWQVEGLYIEVEHHGVWKNKSGVLIDVSPQFANAPSILFLPDDRAPYKADQPLPNRFFPDSDSPLSIEFSRLAERRIEILNKYRKFGVGEVTLSVNDQTEINQIVIRLNKLHAMYSS